MTVVCSILKHAATKCHAKPKSLLSSVFLVLWLVAAWGVAVAAGAEETGKERAESTEQLWYGTMRIKDVRQFRFVLKIAPQGDNWSGVLKSLDEGGRQFEMTDIVRTDSRFKFELRKTAAVYEGTFDINSQAIKGKWKQGGGEVELEFRPVKELPQRKVKSAWKGTINTLIQKLEVAFVELETGDFVFDSISQKAGGFLAKDESKEDDVIYRVPAVRGTFKGKHSDDKSQIEGKWSQGLARFDLVLKRVGPRDLAAKKVSRPQTPRPPFPYDSKQVTFASVDKDVTLTGTLTTPHTSIAACVVLVSGSGPQDRDETLVGHKPFWVIADHFARHGIATLRYDDRGIGQSKGNFGTATSFDFANDAEGALKHLRSLSELKGVPVGLCGHSEGGLIAPIVAARNDQTAFIVMMAGTGVKGEQILYNQARLILEAEGVTEAEIQSHAKFQRALLSTVVEHFDSSQEDLEEKVTDTLKKVLSEKELEEDDFTKKVKAGVAQVSSPWFRTFLTLDPREWLTKVRCPVLVINGEKDLQVDPKLNLPAIRAALAKARNNRFEIVEYPGLNHLFQACKTGSVSEYEDIEETFNEKPLSKMTDWILALRSGG